MAVAVFPSPARPPSIFAAPSPPTNEAKSPANQLESITGGLLYRSFSQAFTAAFFDNNAPKLRPGQPRIEERALLSAFLEFQKSQGAIPEGFSPKSFHTFTSRAMRRIHNELGITAADLRTLPALAGAIKDALEVHYHLLLVAEMPESMAGRRGHMYSASFVQDLQNESQTVFNGERLARVQKTAVNQVLMGRYPGLPQARRRYQTILRDARATCGGDPILEPLVRTTATLIFCGNFKSAAHFKRLYRKNHAACTGLFGSDPETASTVRSAALLVTMRRSETPQEAKLRLDSITADCKKRYPKIEGRSEQLRMTRLLVFLGKYASLDGYDARLAVVRRGVAEALKHYPGLMSLEATIINETMGFKYRSGSKAVEALARYSESAKIKFGQDPILGPLAASGVVATFRKEFRDLNHWEREQRRRIAAEDKTSGRVSTTAGKGKVEAP